jgi:hypothetical protein
MAIEALLHASDLSVNKRHVKAINEIINGYPDNIASYHHELSLRTSMCVVFILPVRCIEGKTEDKKRS